MAPSFFKILLDPSSSHLPLPPDFVSRHLKNEIPKDLIVCSVKGGYSWRIKIEKISGDYCFAHGWNNVVKDTQLGFGDFLVFWLVGQSTFKFLVYGPNGCQKDLPQKFKVEHNGSSVDDDHHHYEEDIKDDIDGDPSFVSIISATHRSKLRLPGQFVGLPGIDGEKTIMLKNLDGKEWKMQLRVDKSYRSSERYHLSTGWPNFRRFNNLSEGDECVFKFIRSEGKLCLSKVTKASQPQTSGEVPATEVVKREREEKQRLPRGHGGGVNVESEDVEVVKRPTATEVVKREWEKERPPSGHGVGVDVESEDVEVAKRPRGEPPQRKCHVIYF